MGAILVGLSENLILATGGVFTIGVGFAFAFWLNRVIWQVKAAPEVLGRVSSLRIMICIVAQSAGVLASGPLAESVFVPLMEAGGGLAGSVGTVIGVGANRGMALMYIIAGGTLIALAVASFITGPVRRLEDALPDQARQPEANADVEAQRETVNAGWHDALSGTDGVAGKDPARADRQFYGGPPPMLSFS